VRPGRRDDLPGVLGLWRDDVRDGRRDSVPGEDFLGRMMPSFDWAARSRIVERPGGELDGAVLVSNRATVLGAIANVEASAAHGRPELLDELIHWGLGLSRAAGAVAAQVWRGREHGQGLDRLGLKPARDWWRMDRTIANDVFEPSTVAGYELHDASDIPPGRWAEVHNLAFADHWRFTPGTEDGLMAGRPAALSVMAVTFDGSPAALSLCQIERYAGDPRPQPVGIVSSVGTAPEHRRRGLATWLGAESLVRLRQAGARHASLYVDAQSPVRAFDAYTKLGFKVAFETQVWEATFQ
jgi:ribosomal protein S18 acetylase RimI-like enzyme